MGFPDSTYVFVRVLKPFSTHVALLESAEGTFESLPSMELVIHIIAHSWHVLMGWQSQTFR